MALDIPFLELFLTVGALLLGLLWMLKRNRMDPRFPPGPTQLPFIGNIHQIGRNPQKQFAKWADEFGAAYSINLAGEKFIHLNDPKLIKEVFSDSRANLRTTHPVFVAFAQGYHGLIMAEGEHWQEQRRFTVRTLKELGFAKTSMETLILDEAVAMVKWFEQRLDQPIPDNGIFNGAVVNSLWKIMSGERSDWDTPNRPELIERVDRVMETLNRLVDTGIFFFPSLRHILPNKLGWTDYIMSVDNMVGASRKAMEEHKRNLDPDNPGDMIDQYLIEIQKTSDPKSSFYKELGEKNLVALVSDLFLAGSETTSTGLSYCFLLLSHHPPVQQKLQKELDSYLGRERQPSLADKPGLPYVTAITMESLRMGSVSVNGVPHKMSEDAVIGGYFFPKGISVMGNTYRVHNDPKIWGDPENFRPERFLSADGKTVIRNEAFHTFSVGKRMCIGKTLAEDTMFLFIASIFQKFSVKPADGQDGYTIDPGTKLLNYTHPFQVVVSLRK